MIFNVLKYIGIALLVGLIFFILIKGMEFYTKVKLQDIKETMLLHQTVQCVQILESGNNEEFKACVSKLKNIQNETYLQEQK